MRLVSIWICVLLLSGSAGASAAVTPAQREDPPVQRGLASFYGPGFNGEPTASGEIFDERKLVAASRTLPLGSVVRVTNVENGRSVRLRIVDRGPYGKNYRKGCIIDVSKRAARKLGFIEDGLTRVVVHVLKRGRSEKRRDRDR